MTKIKYLTIILTCFISQTYAQTATILFKDLPASAFAFTKSWDYPAGTIKDDSGTLHKETDGKLKRADTAHLYYTAKVKTNVQGGYTIRYCAAKRKGQQIDLLFADGMPAYANTFNVIIKNRKFAFQPDIIYPNIGPGPNLKYKIIGQKLVLTKANLSTATTISGYIDVIFAEATSDRKYFLKGYFKTAVN